MIYQGHDTHRMWATDAIELLEILASDQDPIIYKRKDTTPRDLYYLDEISVKRAAEVRISFYGEGAGLRKGSNLKQMVEDRIRLKERDRHQPDGYDSMDTRELREACERKLFQWLGSIRSCPRKNLTDFAGILGVEKDE